MVFAKIVDGFDIAMRVMMRVRSWVAPMGVAELPFGFRMNCDTRDFIQRRAYYFRIYEPNLTHYIRQRVQPGDCVADVGANVGYITMVAATAVGPNGSVVSIEASPKTYSKLKANLDLNAMRHVTAINVAATDGPCSVDIQEGEARNSGTASIGSGGAKSVKVKGDSLTNLLGLRARVVKLIKIDIEGSEGPVLDDILENIEKYEQLRSIVVELSDKNAAALPRFVAKEFKLFALPNNYNVSHYLVRLYLARSDEGSFVIKRPVDGFQPGVTDYVLERDNPADAFREVLEPEYARQG